MNNKILEQNNARWLFESAAEAMYIVDPLGIVIAANPKGESLFGYSAGELDGRPIETLLPDKLHIIQHAHRITYTSHPTILAMGAGLVVSGLHKNGMEFPIDISLNPLQTATKIIVLIAIRDISTLKRAEKLLQESKEQLKIARQQTEEALCDSETRFSTLFNSAADSLFIFDLNGTIKDVNYSAYERLGYTRSEMLGMNITQTKSTEFATKLPKQLAQVIKNGNAIFESANRHKNGTIIPVEVNSTMIRVRGEEMIFNAVRDITERKQAEEKIIKLAYFDYLTGLPNRRLFYDRLNESMAQAKRYRQRLAILFLDLDGFKQINDSFGHHIGDELLQEVAQRLRLNIREADTAARVGGDEFIVLLNHIIHNYDPAVVADKIIRGLTEPFFIQGEKCSIGASIGIAIFPDDSQEMDTLITLSDNAMYKAKELGKNNFQFFAYPAPE
ncbi:MAG: sensor domain-containing protein [Sulfuriferula sp.]